MAVLHLCRCGDPVYRIASGRYVHDNGRDECADGQPGRSTLDDGRPVVDPCRVPTLNDEADWFGYVDAVDASSFPSAMKEAMKGRAMNDIAWRLGPVVAARIGSADLQRANRSVFGAVA